jgi:hypothetical protein
MAHVSTAGEIELSMALADEAMYEVAAQPVAICARV